MPKTVEELEQAVSSLETQYKDMEKRAEAAEAALVVSSLSKEDREIYDTLDEETQKAFPSMAEDARAKLLTEQKDKVEAEKKVQETKKIEALPPEIREELTQLRKSQQDADTRLKAAEEVAKSAREEVRMVELTKRASDELPHVPGEAADKAKIIKSIEDHIPEGEERDAVMGVLTSAEEAYKATTKSVGEAPKGGDGGTTAWDDIEKRAQKVVTDSDGKVTYSDAVEQVIKTEPKLYDAYLKEQGTV